MVIVDLINKKVSADGLSWTFDLAAKGSNENIVYEGPSNDNWQAMNLRLDLALPAGVTVVSGSGVGDPSSTTGEVGVQLSVPGNAPLGTTEIGLTLARSAAPGQMGQQDITVNQFTTLATFTINFSAQVLQSNEAIPRAAVTKQGSSWTNVADFKRRPISFVDERGTITLPVTLISFDAQKENATARLSWSTSEEVDADYFEVQKSTDGKQWHTLTKIKAKSAGKQISKYEATDEEPFNGTNLYRLHMVDLDGSATYSAIRNLSFDVPGVAVYPNPVQKVLNIQSHASKAKSVEIINAAGQMVYKGGVTANAVDVSAYTAGKYIINVLLDNGSSSKHEVLVTP